VKSECELCTFTASHIFVMYITMKGKMAFNIMWLELNGVLKGIIKSINKNLF
jgi:hypothetical protein